MDSRRAQALLAALLLARLALTLSPLHRYLRDDHQLAGPLTSFTRLSEGVFLLKHDIPPYAGGVFRHDPLTLALFATLLPPTQALAALVWTVADALSAWSLVDIWRARVRGTHDDLNKSREVLIAALFLLNPYTLLPSLALSTSTLSTALSLLSLRFAALGRPSPALLLHALLTLPSLPSVLLLPPLILVLLSSPLRPAPHPKPAFAWSRAAPLVAEWAAYLALFVGLGTLVSGSTDWIQRTWGAVVTLPDLTPNPGLWWYFFTEMFDHYRPFFLLTFSLHPVIYVLPLCIKFAHDPLYALFLIQGIIAAFKSYPTLADAGLTLSLLSLFPETYSYLRHPLPTALLHLHSALLLPLFHHLWLAQGTGNANFFYASTLVYGLAGCGGVVDAVWAGLRLGVGEMEGAEKGEEWEVVQL